MKMNDAPCPFCGGTEIKLRHLGASVTLEHHCEENFDLQLTDILIADNSVEEVLRRWRHRAESSQ